jgi:two-component system OmpR family sensor kinase
MTPTAGRPTTAGPTTPEPVAGPPVGRRILWGIRARMLTWYVVVLAVAIGASVLVVRQVLIAQLDERIDSELVQESDELRRLSRGRDPTTGEPFGNRVRRIFEVFLRRNIPSRNETFVTFVDGEPFERSFREPPYRLDRDPELVARWSELSRADRGRVATPAGDIEYVAVPVRSGGRTLGVFVAAIFRDAELVEIQRAVLGAAWVGLATLVIGSILAWRVAGGVLRRVRIVTDTARGASADLTRRLEVTGNDEISHLALTFNGMLDQLEELMETQRRFVDDAGHELRTPITVIRGHLELLDDDPQERVRTLALVTDELDRMQRIVNDLLVLAKAERPDFLDLAPVPLDRLTDEIRTKAQALGDRDWQVEATAGGIVIGDRQRLTQAVMQLAENAVQHTQDGAEIAVGSSMRNGEARLWVRDTGPGIPVEQRDRIFARFSRGAGRRRSEGAGLGLAIVRAIAEAHHGRVEVDSSPGSGATVSVVIPIDQPDEVTDE